MMTHQQRVLVAEVSLPTRGAPAKARTVPPATPLCPGGFPPFARPLLRVRRGGLCANVILGGLLPSGTIVRRNYSFRRGGKGWFNRVYRRLVDRTLARRHRLVDLFFSVRPLDPPSHIQKILSLASQFTVEVDVLPINPEEHRFLSGSEISRWTGISRLRHVSPCPSEEASRSEGLGLAICSRGPWFSNWSTDARG